MRKYTILPICLILCAAACSDTDVESDESMSADQLSQTQRALTSGTVTMRRDGNLAPDGLIQLQCWSTDEIVSAPADLRGVEISVYCPNAHVTATCYDGNRPFQFIEEFIRTVNGTEVELAINNSTIISDTMYLPSGSQADYLCRFSD